MKIEFELFLRLFISENLETYFIVLSYGQVVL